MKQCKRTLSWLTLCSLLLAQKSIAVTFNTALLAGKSGESDMTRFYDDRDMPIGDQEMDVYVNNNWKGRYTLFFGEKKADTRINKNDAGLLGLDLSQLQSGADTGGSFTLGQIIQGGSVDVDTSVLSVRLTVPQRFIQQTEAGYVSPSLWDEGVPALMLSYNTTWYKTMSKKAAHSTDDDIYVGLDSGVNLAGWQFRDSSTWRQRSGAQGKWQNNTRYVRKPLAAIKSNLMGGDFYTSGTLFDSVRMRGVSLTSDMTMYPNSQQGFSPIVHGVAQTNALVSVIQNGTVIWQENVPPGQFTLDNIQPTGSSGDLLVVVHEADGKEQSFTVPFSAVPGMLKEGVDRYSLTAGKVNQTASQYNPAFVQGTYERGLSNLVTGYAGTILSDDYRAWLLGSGWNLPIGALSVDVTHADTQLQYKKESGQSFRVAYSKFMAVTATNFTLAAYRYSTKGYYSFSDAIYSREGYQRYIDSLNDSDPLAPEQPPAVDMNTWDALRSARPKNTFTLNLNQRLADNWGTVFFSGTERDYWNQATNSREYQLGYSNIYKRMSYSLSASRIRNTDREVETRYYLSLSVPLSLFDNPAWLSAGMSSTGSHYQQSNVTLSGNALDSNRLSYALSGSNQQGGQNMASANVAYRSTFSTLGGSFSESRDYQQAGLSARGSLVAIPWHVLASNEIGNTLMVVDAPKAKGLMVNGDSSIVTNDDGLALIPYATPYRKNTVTLSNTDEASGAEVKGNLANRAPYDGAVNVIHFDTDRRQSWTLHARNPQGKALPFGAEVVDENNQSVGFVGQSSVLYVKADAAPIRLSVLLNDERCTITNPPLSLDSQPGVCR
jgi:outer membrane usher protein